MKLQLTQSERHFLNDEILKPGLNQFNSDNAKIEQRFLIAHDKLFNSIFLDLKIAKSGAVPPAVLFINYLHRWLEDNKEDVSLLTKDAKRNNKEFIWKVNVVSRVLNNSKVKYKKFNFEVYFL